MNKQIECKIHGESDSKCTDDILLRYECINCLEDKINIEKDKK
jgi:hypothetical protein